MSTSSPPKGRDSKTGTAVLDDERDSFAFLGKTGKPNSATLRYPLKSSHPFDAGCCMIEAEGITIQRSKFANQIKDSLMLLVYGEQQVFSEVPQFFPPFFWATVKITVKITLGTWVISHRLRMVFIQGKGFFMV